MKRIAVSSLLVGLVAVVVAAAWWWSIGQGAVRPTKISAQGPLRIVALGDSLALGYGSPNPPRDGFIALLADRTERERRGSVLENDAVGGSTISGIATRELARVKLHPDVVIAVSGGNDVQMGALPPAVASATARMVDAVHHRFPTARVLVTDIPDVSRVPMVPTFARAPFHGLIALDNLALHRAARAHGAVVLPLYAISRSPLSADPANFSTDGLHPSSLGYRRLAERIWPSFERAIVR